MQAWGLYNVIQNRLTTLTSWKSDLSFPSIIFWKHLLIESKSIILQAWWSWFDRFSQKLRLASGERARPTLTPAEILRLSKFTNSKANWGAACRIRPHSALHTTSHWRLKCCETNLFVLWENPQPRSDPPHSQNGTMAKDAWWVRKVYWRRERALDKTERELCVWCDVQVHL